MRAFLILTLFAALTPAIISQQIRKQGVAKTVDTLYADEGTWYELTSGIATGEVAWINVSNTITPNLDGHAAESINLALGEALEHNPAVVLRTSKARIESICGGPDVDDARYDSRELSMEAIELRKRNVKAITDPKLRKKRDRCVAALEESKAGISKFYGSTFADDAEVLRVVTSDPHFVEWRQCGDGRYVMLEQSEPPAYENDKPYFFTQTERGSNSPDPLPSALLQALRARNATKVQLAPLGIVPDKVNGGTATANLWLSLPGYDAATDRAAVAVTRGTLESCPAAGYIVVLRHTARGWRVESRPTEWVE